MTIAADPSRHPSLDERPASLDDRPEEIAIDRRYVHPGIEPHRPARARVRAAAVATGVVGGAAITYVVVHDPTNGSLVPSCPLRETTGLWCPGCGMTRAVHALTNGDPVKAFKLNLFVIPVMLSFGLLYGAWLLRAFGYRAGRPDVWFASRPRLIFATLAVMTVFTVVRNLPGFEFLIGQ